MSPSMSSLRHEGSDYPGFIDNDSRRDYEAILLAAYERSSPLSSIYLRLRPQLSRRTWRT
jgi:hypothetical protein